MLGTPELAGYRRCCDRRRRTAATPDRGVLRFPHRHRSTRSAFRSHARSAPPVDVEHLRLVSLVGPADQGFDLKARLVEAPKRFAGALNEVVPDVATLQRRADGARSSLLAAPITLEVTRSGAPHPADVDPRRGRRPDPARLYERGFPQGHGRLSQQASAELQGQIEFRAGTGETPDPFLRAAANNIGLRICILVQKIFSRD